MKADEKTYAFIAGCPRSGTTALATLVNRHPDVAIGFERFGRLAAVRKLTPDLFESERFTSFSTEDTHHKGYEGDPDREPVIRKIGTARVVGDKAPQLVGKLDQLTKFPNVKLLYIVREPGSVAKSYDRRAHSEKDKGWSIDRDHQAAVRKFNQAMQDLEYLEKEQPFEYLILPYEQLFSGEFPISVIFNFLGVEPTRVQDVEDIFIKSETLSDKKRGLSLSGQYVALNADFDRYRIAMNSAADQIEQIVTSRGLNGSGDSSMFRRLKPEETK